MSLGRQKSRALRKVFRRAPSGKIKIHHGKRKPKKARCASCGAVLKGVPRESPRRMGRIAGSKKKPQRPYGGNLCSNCMRIKMIKKARAGA